MSRNKYHNKKTMRIIDGKPVEFASKKEAERYGDLRLLERAGRIRSLERQHDFVLLPTQRDAKGEILEHAVRYRADFTYYEHDEKTGKWRYVVEDVKGMRTSTYLIKRKLMLKEHGIRIREV